MSDRERRELSRRAGDGDLVAAERLVVLLRREQDRIVLEPETRLADIPPEQLVEVVGKKSAVVLVLRFLDFYEKRTGESIDTINELSELSEKDIRAIPLAGTSTVEAIKALVRAAGLAWKGRGR